MYQMKKFIDMEQSPLSMFLLFDSRRIIRRVICESMLPTKIQKLLQCTVALLNQIALQSLCFFLKQTDT